tara:strand:- start:5087 stop:7336 length:2250 start_codon:yes stop_codon:yes gene_type:complete
MGAITEYAEFLASKFQRADNVGFEPPEINPMLFDFQKDIVQRSCRKGRAACFAGTGLGKTPMQLEWAKCVVGHTRKPVLIFAPLAVAQQTKREGEKFGVEVVVCRKQSDCSGGVNIANYEMLRHFDSSKFGGVVLDESSILKGFSGKIRSQLTEFGNEINYRLACTATPAPNDLIELLNHAEFLGIMRGKEIIALYFTQDGNTTHKWRLKHHAHKDFWRWLASWAVAVRKPSDMGYEDGRFNLPELRRHHHLVDCLSTAGYLFPMEARTLSERLNARRGSIDDRVDVAAQLANRTNEPFICWCNLNDESSKLAKAIPDAVEVRGSQSVSVKEDILTRFSSGDIRVLVTKPTICGFGLNWQHCREMAFVGLSDSFEQQYQAIRRCWRFGQEKPVDVHVVTAETESAVVRNVQRKERETERMMSELVGHMKEEQLDGKAKRTEVYSENVQSGDGWKLFLGDCMERTAEVPDESIGLSVFSPPFPGMYAYTDTTRDVGNCKSFDELIEHFDFLVDELLRITMPGRLCAIHLTQEPVFKGQAGYAGRRDFRGKVIGMMERHNWIYTSEVTIDKNPQVKASRTKDHALLFKTLGKDSAGCAPCMADYLLIFRKHGENPEPIAAGTRENKDRGWITPNEWIEWAAPVWYRQTDGYPGGIRETDVLNVRAAREEKDERHLCPLQLGVIERTVKLWSNPGDTVFSPFAGIGSEGYQALMLKRKFIGIELKKSYFDTACRNLRLAASKARESLGYLFE